MKTTIAREQGFTLAELLVSLMLFNIIALVIATFMAQGFQKLGLESRVTLASFELRNAVALMTEEIKMSSSASPYLPGIVPELTDCSSVLSVDGNSLRMVSTSDSENATNAVQPYYVGYVYDPDSRELRRGELPMSSNTTCDLPADDPRDNANAYLIADRVVPIDIDGDGIDEPIFSLNGGQVVINLGVEAVSPSGERVLQRVSTAVIQRVRS